MFNNGDGCFSIHVTISLLLLITIVQAQGSFPGGKYQKYINQKALFHEKRQEQQHTTLIYNIPPPSFNALHIDNNSNDSNDTIAKPYRFAKSIPISISSPSNKKDYWSSMTINSDNDDRSSWHWRVQIKSVGALSLSLIFDQWWIPEHAEVYVYNRETMLGAFKANPSNKRSNQFATTPLKGDSIILEYFQPKHIIQLPKIHISRLVYGFKPLRFLIDDMDHDTFSSRVDEEEQQLQKQLQQHVLMTTYGRKRRRRPQSGKCNVDLSCDTAGEDWTDEGRAVAVLLTNENQVYCTGVLINNAEKDGRQLLLTAYHCANEDGGNSDTDIIMFNHQKRSCNNNSDTASSSLDTLHGLNYLTGSSKSDYALYEIQEPIPKSYNVYLAGWSTINEPKPPLVGIHHPSGDFKKLSIYNGQLNPTCWSECPHMHHWKVEHWTRGTTEPGSSGSPLFDSNHKVVGQLHGGSASCWNKNGYDVYGSFRYSWDHGLSEYLDPRNRTNGEGGEISLGGIYLDEIK